MSAKFHFSADVDCTNNLQSITSGTLRDQIHLDFHPLNLESSSQLKPSNEFGAESVSSLKRTRISSSYLQITLAMSAKLHFSADVDCTNNPRLIESIAANNIESTYVTM